MRAAAAAFVPLASVVIVLGAGCQEKPPSCEPLRQRLERMKRDAGGVYAVRAVKTADDVVNAAAEMVDMQDRRAAFLRAYDAKACTDALAAITAADEAVGRARRNQNAIEEQLQKARASLDDSKAFAARATVWTDADITVGDKIAAIREMKKQLADDENRLDRERNAVKIGGYDVPPELMQALAAQYQRRSEQAAALEDETRAQALARCKPTLDKKVVVDVSDVVAMSPFVVMHGKPADGAATFFFVVDGEESATTKRCTQLYVEKKGKAAAQSPAGAAAADEKLYVWKPHRPLPNTILVGWSGTGAWFLLKDGGGAGRWRSLSHAKVAKASTGFSCNEEVRCAEPQLGVEIVGHCSCGTTSTFDVRYVYDGYAVTGEQ